MGSHTHGPRPAAHASLQNEAWRSHSKINVSLASDGPIFVKVPQAHQLRAPAPEIREDQIPALQPGHLSLLKPRAKSRTMGTSGDTSHSVFSLTLLKLRSQVPTSLGWARRHQHGTLELLEADRCSLHRLRKQILWQGRRLMFCGRGACWQGPEPPLKPSSSNRLKCMAEPVNGKAAMATFETRHSWHISLRASWWM